MFKLSNLRSPAGSNHKPTRRGKGIGSGLGKTAGKGHKGQKARAGGQVHAMFEGGQVSLQRRLPKTGFRSHLKFNKVSVNITEMGAFAGQTLSIKDLMPKSMTSRARAFVSIMGTKVPKTFPKSVEAHRVSPMAKQLLEKNGVAIKLLPYMDGARSVKKPRVRKSKA